MILLVKEGDKTNVTIGVCRHMLSLRETLDASKHCFRLEKVNLMCVLCIQNEHR